MGGFARRRPRIRMASSISSSPPKSAPAKFRFAPIHIFVILGGFRRLVSITVSVIGWINYILNAYINRTIRKILKPPPFQIPSIQRAGFYSDSHILEFVTLFNLFYMSRCIAAGVFFHRSNRRLYNDLNIDNGVLQPKSISILECGYINPPFLLYYVNSGPSFYSVLDFLRFLIFG